jgi:dihydroorotase
MSYDLVIAGGTVIDPASGLGDLRDVAIRDGLIAAVEPHIPRAEASDLLDATDLIVVPGLVDLHVHVYWGVASLSIPPGSHDLQRGATTIVDAGSSGGNTFPGFRQFVIEPFAGTILAFLNISAMGQIDPELGELHDLRYAMVDRAVEVARANRDLIVGIKVRLSEMLAGPNGLAGLERAIEAGEAIERPVMAHIGGTAFPIEDVLVRLRPGDIVTHAFTGWQPGIVDSAGRIVPEALEARARGVRFDIGHGAGSFRFHQAEAALAQGFRPDTISSDLHRFNWEGPVHDLVTTMSKFLHLGLALPEVTRMATTAPAEAIGRKAEMGTLAVGAVADMAVLRLEEGRFEFTDSGGVSVEGRQRLVPVATVKRGRQVRAGASEAATR